MTNGEKLDQVFPDGICPFSKKWLDCEYKKSSLSSALEKNSQKLENASPIIDWNNCHTSEQIDSISTTKNDLGVREFEEIVVEYPPEDLCTYPEYKGKPYFGIKYKENEKEIVGYGTYKPEVLSQYLKNYFISTTKNDLEVDAISRSDVLKLMQDNWHTHNGDWAMEESMDDIRALPSVTPQEPTTKNDLGVDAVSRQAINGYIDYILSHGMGKKKSFDYIKKFVEELPSATPTRPKGHWLRMSDLSEQKDDRYKCSRCGNVIHHKNKMDLYTFNSWCGRCGSDNGRHINYEVEE